MDHHLHCPAVQVAMHECLKTTGVWRHKHLFFLSITSSQQASTLSCCCSLSVPVSVFRYSSPSPRSLSVPVSVFRYSSPSPRSLSVPGSVFRHPDDSFSHSKPVGQPQTVTVLTLSPGSGFSASSRALCFQIPTGWSSIVSC